jgi:hypothetical protein
MPLVGTVAPDGISAEPVTVLVAVTVPEEEISPDASTLLISYHNIRQ